MTAGVRRALFVSFALTLVGSAGACSDAAPLPASRPLELDADRELSAGEGTIFDTTKNAFAYPLRNLSGPHRDTFALGDHFFNRSWVPAGTPSTSDNVGLGPTFVATSCSACHFKDGRGAPPERNEAFVSLLVRLSIPGEDAHGGPADEPSYGGQLNPSAVPGVPGEGTPRVAYVDEPGTYGDGASYVLRRPVYTFEGLAFGPLAANALYSPRVAPGTYGLGLLEAVDESTIVALADPDDKDGDGISGRPNYVWDARKNARGLGRFGWKANKATIEQQTAGAFLGDIGATSSLNPREDCPLVQVQCRAAKTGRDGAPDLGDKTLDAVTVYGLTIAVPARRDVGDPTVERGERLFFSSGCANCHSPKMVTGDYPGYPEMSRQTIRPFSDMLLHDMGLGLADGRPDYLATGSEWRTPPLWGIGLVKTVNRHERFLHDGRARGFEEAVLWHDGEAKPSREAFRTMPATDRDAMVRFLGSL